MFKKNTKLFVMVLFILVATRKSICWANPQYMEYYANYRNYPEDDKLNYKFRYYIDHSPTKVHMMHLEERQGDKVMGQYGLLEPNGMVRLVHYQVVGKSGFQSVVQTRTPYSTTHIRLTNQKQPTLPIIFHQPVAAVI